MEFLQEQQKPVSRITEFYFEAAELKKAKEGSPGLVTVIGRHLSISRMLKCNTSSNWW
jgi:hypothetical protein